MSSYPGALLLLPDNHVKGCFEHRSKTTPGAIVKVLPLAE